MFYIFFRVLQRTAISTNIKVRNKCEHVFIYLFTVGNNFSNTVILAWSNFSLSFISTQERLDFSCAMFGPDGGLVANAPHIPVHLGAMQETVQFQVI